MNKTDSEYVTASEIGQYTFCSVSWRIKKFQPVPTSLKEEEGTKKHVELGNVVDQVQTTERYVSKLWKLAVAIGVLLFVLIGGLLWFLLLR